METDKLRKALLILTATFLITGQAGGQESASAPPEVMAGSQSAPAALERLRSAAPEAAAFPNTILAGYPVDATSQTRIRAILSATGPIGAGGKRHHGLTNWSYQTRYATRNGACLPETATLTYDITITLPDLVSRDRLRRGELAIWDRYFDALVKHELNHARIFAAGSAKMLAGMRAATTCEELHAAVARVKAEVDAVSLDYDRQTKHGELEGAVY